MKKNLLFKLLGSGAIVGCSTLLLGSSALACSGSFSYYLAGMLFRGASYYGNYATGTQATFNAQQPPLCSASYGSTSAAWVALVNRLNAWIAQDGWAETYNNGYSRGFYEYSTPSNGSYVQVYVNGGEQGIGFTYKTAYNPNTGVFSF